MIKHWFCTGDTHGQNIVRLGHIAQDIVEKANYKPEETAVIILGDAGYNFYLNNTDKKGKQDTFNMCVYCVRGNHEERPENLGYQLWYDENVKGRVYIDPINSKIRYFQDGGEYIIDKHPTLVIGGAYSVDKWYRLHRAKENGLSQSGWFKDEQLTEEEMATIEHRVCGRTYDFVLTHTCPLDWEPTDLFLDGIDQSTVDKSMENWFNVLKDEFNWKVWLFGHYHSDRIERKGVEMFFRDYDELSTIWDRWTSGRELDWWLTKSPNYDEG